MPHPYDRTTYGGHTVDWLTRAALEATALRLGYDLTVLQGSYNTGGVSASAGTHDGGGAVDLAPADWQNKVREMRRTGFAAWHRPELWVNGKKVWGEHIHCVLIGNRKLSPAAQVQVAEYLRGEDGLADHRPDDGPRDFVNNRFRWRTGAKRISHAAALIEKARATLSTGIRGYQTRDARTALREAAQKLPKP